MMPTHPRLSQLVVSLAQIGAVERIKQLQAEIETIERKFLKQVRPRPDGDALLTQEPKRRKVKNRSISLRMKKLWADRRGAQQAKLSGSISFYGTLQEQVYDYVRKHPDSTVTQVALGIGKKAAGNASKPLETLLKLGLLTRDRKTRGYSTTDVSVESMVKAKKIAPRG